MARKPRVSKPKPKADDASKRTPSRAKKTRSPRKKLTPKKEEKGECSEVIPDKVPEERCGEQTKHDESVESLPCDKTDTNITTKQAMADSSTADVGVNDADEQDLQITDELIIDEDEMEPEDDNMTADSTEADRVENKQTDAMDETEDSQTHDHADEEMEDSVTENESADARTASQKADANKDKDAPSTTDSSKDTTEAATAVMTSTSETDSKQEDSTDEVIIVSVEDKTQNNANKQIVIEDDENDLKDEKNDSKNASKDTSSDWFSIVEEEEQEQAKKKQKQAAALSEIKVAKKHLFASTIKLGDKYKILPHTERIAVAHGPSLEIDSGPTNLYRNPSMQEYREFAATKRTAITVKSNSINLMDNDFIMEAWRNSKTVNFVQETDGGQRVAFTGWEKWLDFSTLWDKLSKIENVLCTVGTPPPSFARQDREKEVLAVYRLPPALFENEKEGKKLLEKALPGSKCLAVFKKESTCSAFMLFESEVEMMKVFADRLNNVSFDGWRTCMAKLTTATQGTGDFPSTHYFHSKKDIVLIEKNLYTINAWLMDNKIPNWKYQQVKGLIDMVLAEMEINMKYCSIINHLHAHKLITDHVKSHREKCKMQRGPWSTNSPIKPLLDQIALKLSIKLLQEETLTVNKRHQLKPRGGATSRAQAFAFNKVGTFFRQRSHWTQPLRPVPRAGFMTVNRNRMRGTTAPVRGHHLPIRINKLNPTKRSLSRATRIHPTPPQEHRPVHVEEFHPVHTEPSKPRSNEVPINPQRNDDRFQRPSPRNQNISRRQGGVARGKSSARGRIATRGRGMSPKGRGGFRGRGDSFKGRSAPYTPDIDREVTIDHGRHPSGSSAERRQMPQPQRNRKEPRRQHEREGRYYPEQRDRDIDDRPYPELDRRPLPEPNHRPYSEPEHRPYPEPDRHSHIESDRYSHPKPDRYSHPESDRYSQPNHGRQDGVSSSSALNLLQGLSNVLSLELQRGDSTPQHQTHQPHGDQGYHNRSGTKRAYSPDRVYSPDRAYSPDQTRHRNDSFNEPPLQYEGVDHNDSFDERQEKRGRPDGYRSGRDDGYNKQRNQYRDRKARNSYSNRY